MDEQDAEFELTTRIVRAVLDPWLVLHFGNKCSQYSPGCECCERWKLAEELLAIDRVNLPESGPS